MTFNMSLPSYSELELGLVISEVQLSSETLSAHGHALQRGPFGVFRREVDSPLTGSFPHSTMPAPETSPEEQIKPWSADSHPPEAQDSFVDDFHRANLPVCADASFLYDVTSSIVLDHVSPLSISSDDLSDTGPLLSDPRTPAQRSLSPELNLFSSVKQCELFHHWRRYLSRLMIPFATENPYLTIITPMAELADPDSIDSANSAVFWSILAVSAFSKARMVQESSEYTKLGEACYAKSLNILSRCFSSHSPNQGVVVLAAITMNSLIDVFRPLPDSRNNWQLHLQAGRQWMRSQELEFLSHGPNVSILIELIMLVEVLGFSGKRQLEPSLYESLLVVEYSRIERFKLRIPALESSYNLDRMFALPLNIFESIIWTNLLVHQGADARQEEIEALGSQIASSDPAFFHYNRLPDASDEHARMCVRHLFYYASDIYYERQLLHTPVADVQWIVTAAIPYVQGFLSHEHELQGPCLSWPIFIIAAEATDPEIWKLIVAFFDLDRPRQIGNYSGAKEVLLELRRRREDMHPADASLDWTNVMRDMGFDILLV